MFRFIKSIFLLIIFAAIVLGAYLGWLLKVPVTANSAETRMVHACVLGGRFAQMVRPAWQAPHKVQLGGVAKCQCFSRIVVRDLGADVAAQNLEILRLQVGARLEALLGYGGGNSSHGGVIADADYVMRTLSRAEQDCKSVSN